MYYNSIYSQLFNFIPRYRFEKIVKKSDGDRYCKHFTAWKQFLTLLLAQISGKDSLREIENALLACHKRLYHLGTFDKGYYDLNWFHTISSAGAFFVTRIKNNAQIEFTGQQCY